MKKYYMLIEKIKIILMLFTLSLTVVNGQISIHELDSLAVFSFSIISDNKGYSLENSHMYKCDKWIKEAGDSFIIGLGDHVKDNRTNKFLDLLKNDTLWHNHFYPNVADGENEYWGEDQGDWGAGFPILDSVDLSKRKNVKIRENKCEYYAIEEYNEIKVHIIQLHYSDTPDDPLVAFNESSRKYLMNTLDSINKTNNDIVIVLAHTNAWIDKLNSERRNKLLKKADLILEANIHFFKRYKRNSKFKNESLILNTGSVGNSIDSGFLQIHVLKNPTRMIVQYQRTSDIKRNLRKKGYVFEKIIGGKVREIDWGKLKHLQAN
jgi:hypothetical protein